MTLLALDECHNKRLLPRNAEAIRKEIQARMARDLLSRQQRTRATEVTENTEGLIRDSSQDRVLS